MQRKPTMTEWMCVNCGRKNRVSINQGRPAPGNCPRSMRAQNGPHRWVKNRNL